MMHILDRQQDLEAVELSVTGFLYPTEIGGDSGLSFVTHQPRNRFGIHVRSHEFLSFETVEANLCSSNGSTIAVSKALKETMPCFPVESH